MNITLFGGAFDPPHLGHINVIKNFIKLKLTDQLTITPAFSHAFEKRMTSANHRLKMLELIRVKYFSNFNVNISDYEIRKQQVSITFRTLSELSKNNPQNKYSFLIGSDNLINFDKWHNYEKMLGQFTFYVYPRKSFSFSNLKKGMIALENMPEMEISSSLVKKKLLAGKLTYNYLSLEIINYIKKNNLY